MYFLNSSCIPLCDLEVKRINPQWFSKAVIRIKSKFTNEKKI